MVVFISLSLFVLFFFFFFLPRLRPFLLVCLLLFFSSSPVFSECLFCATVYILIRLGVRGAVVLSFLVFRAFLSLCSSVSGLLTETDYCAHPGSSSFSSSSSSLLLRGPGGFCFGFIVFVRAGSFLLRCLFLESGSLR